MIRQNKTLTLVAGTAMSIAAAASAQTRQVVYAENFDGVALGPNVFEGVLCCSTQTVPMAWSATLPAGWTKTFTVVEVLAPEEGGTTVMLENPDIGVTEWQGFNLANEVFWIGADQQRREEFANGFASGAVLVADPDEWDDGDPNGIAGGPDGDSDPLSGIPRRFFNATATSPAFSIAGAAANSVELNLFSSWRPEDAQEATIEVSIDGGAWQVVRRYSSDFNSADFVGDEPNAALTLPIANPGSASTMQVRFTISNAINNWWFAVDDIFVSAETMAGATTAPGWFFLNVPTFNETLTPTFEFEAIGADSYVIEVATDEAFEDIVFSGSTNAAGFTLPGGAVQPGFYYARAFAENAAGMRQSLFSPRFAVDSACAFDLNGDNQSTVTDILIFIAQLRDGCSPPSEMPTIIYEETFEGLPRQDVVSATEVAGTAVWGNVAPAGWTVDNSGVPAMGLPEFEGWTFLDPIWWNQTSGQNRGQFTRGIGTVAVADSDEWADGPSEAAGSFNTVMTTPQIDISGRAANTLSLSFDSSWRPEGAQAAAVLVSFNGGPFTEIFALNSGNTVDDGSNINQAVTVNLNNPAAATVQFRFDYLNGSNNWWWAIDNVRVLEN